MDIREENHNILKGYNLLLYFAGSMITSEPDEECVIDFWQQGILRKLPVSSTNPKFAKAASQLRDSCDDKSLCIKNLRDDFRRLFEDNSFPLAPAYESLYHSDQMTNYNISKVTDFYNSYGWSSRYRGKVRDDHLGMELLFLTKMVDKYLVMDDEVCLAEIRNEIRRFIDLHILSWIRYWNEKMQANSNTICYKGIATLIYACVEDIYSLCDNNPDQTTSRETAKN